MPSFWKNLSTLSTVLSLRLIYPEWTILKMGKRSARGNVRYLTTLGLASMWRRVEAPSAIHFTNFLVVSRF